MTEIKTNEHKKELKKGINIWKKLSEGHPEVSRFLIFFMLSNGITILQMVLMPLFKEVLDNTSLVNTSFQVLQVGQNFDGSPYYVFNYVAGTIANGGGGGLAYFLAVQITMAIAQTLNFFAQRNITFKSKGSLKKAAFWYIIAYLIISIGAAALQGLYKAPIYNLLMNTWGMESLGETLADFITMIINCAISFWVFYPIFKIIFKDKKENK